MPVIIRESKIINGKDYDNIKVYKTNKNLTKKLREKADKLDEFLSNKMNQIEIEITKKGLLEKKGKSGVIELWHEVGKQLSFIDEPELLEPEDFEFIWRAMYDHAPKLVPDPVNYGQRANRPKNNLFYYCYLLGKFDKEFVLNAGNWTVWSEFLDSPAIIKDERIITWLGQAHKKVNQGQIDWLRALTPGIRKEFKNKDTKFIPDPELYSTLDNILEKQLAIQNHARTQKTEF